MLGLRQRCVLKAVSSLRKPSSRNTKFSGGKMQSSNRISCKFSPPIVWYLPVTAKPGVPFSTNTQPMPARPGWRSTRVKTTNIPASSARLIRVLTPLRRSVLPTWSTLVL